MTYSEEGVRVRGLATLVGTVLWVAAVAPQAWAQAKGTITVDACVPCHGAAAPAVAGGPVFPMLDGQQPVYLIKQLREYRSGKRKSPVMAPLAAALQPQQIAVMAAHFSSQAPTRGSSQNADMASRGKTLYEEGNHTSGVPACIGCHMADGVGHERYPRLAGQRQTYIVQQLTEFKSSTRTNDPAHVMRAIAGRLTDDEIKAVAEYLAGR